MKNHILFFYFVKKTIIYKKTIVTGLFELTRKDFYAANGKRVEYKEKKIIKKISSCPEKTQKKEKN